MSDDIVAISDGGGPIIATAIHDGHAVRPEVAELLVLDEATRLREEDPYTGRLAAVAPVHLIALRSRFEVDLNRPREQAVYRLPADAWGLELWRTPCTDELVAASAALHDAFYAVLERTLRARDRFVVLDVHSYNHRRQGPHAEPEPASDNPEINVGTGTLDRARWGGLVDRLCADLSAQEVAGHRLDVRENVRFQGGAMSAWINRTFAGRGCAIALEFKKTFMDEWTGELDADHLDQLGRALAAALPGLRASLAA
jgi:N-formylglutamate deformylase